MTNRFILLRCKFFLLEAPRLPGTNILRRFSCATVKSNRSKSRTCVQDCVPYREIKDPVPFEGVESCRLHKKVELLDIRCKTAIVLGGANGIGYETASALLEGGALHVVVADLDRCKGTEAIEKLNSIHRDNRARYCLCDIRLNHLLDSSFKETIKHCCQVDIFVNCVGIYNETPECWESTVRINLIGTIRGTIMAYHYMSHNRAPGMPQGGCIVNVSSWGSLVNFPSMPVYSAAGSGVNGLSSSFGTDFHYGRTGVRCLALCPGSTDSNVFKNMSTLHYDPKWAAHSESAIKNPQSAKSVARGIVHAIRYGTNGSVYGVHKDQFYKYVMPDYKQLIRQECILF